MTDERPREPLGQEGERSGVPAEISLIYESADGRFCLFEDSKGHLTSVSAAKLA